MLDFQPVPSPDKWRGLLRRRKNGRASQELHLHSFRLRLSFTFHPPFLPLVLDSLDPLFLSLLPAGRQCVGSFNLTNIT